ncbi:class I SAM-dependent methyltransferase [Enterovibrio coralii]|uniref:Methyltransferase type 11 domain-containing protein n=1 Tax=Enterovibrio coralii TaxID=294935 RepID=A0A135IBV2_9GAMM|nr:class I SAM-dependent methyltransferase [Enterovibrio coralii]KXF82824.1 hypothetical protein ATN88_23400 [Enterovibrio coralii]
MSDNYDSRTAHHYAAFRPPLHSLILSNAISGRSDYSLGLDVGCGTGYSSLALKNHCANVIGVEPSEAMLTLAKAQQPDGIRYLHGAGEAIPVEDNTIDIVTFAGSLFYAKSQQLVNEIKRVCLPNATVVAYDFDVVLDDALNMLGVDLKSSSGDYDHAINFSDYAEFAEHAVVAETIQLSVSAQELAHVLLSSTGRYDALANIFGDDDLHEKVARRIEQGYDAPSLPVNTYYSTYQL